MDLSKADLLADGRVYQGEQSLQLGLIDSVGTLDDALNVAGELAGLGKNPIVIRHVQSGVRAFFNVFRRQMGAQMMGTLFTQWQESSMGLR